VALLEVGVGVQPEGVTDAGRGAVELRVPHAVGVQP
jgi:hypothetical protein